MARKSKEHMAGTVQVSPHLIRIYQALVSSREWVTVSDITAAAKVARRTAAHHLARMARAGVVKEEQVFGGYRYRLAQDMTKEASALVDRIKRAAGVFQEEATHGSA